MKLVGALSIRSTWQPSSDSRKKPKSPSAAPMSAMRPPAMESNTERRGPDSSASRCRMLAIVSYGYQPNSAGAIFSLRASRSSRKASARSRRVSKSISSVQFLT
ncbi:hypothetical protein ACFQ0O_36725 [Saccharopolyspora spinosporotrichia]